MSDQVSIFEQLKAALGTKQEHLALINLFFALLQQQVPVFGRILRHRQRDVLNVVPLARQSFKLLALLIRLLVLFLPLEIGSQVVHVATDFHEDIGNLKDGLPTEFVGKSRECLMQSLEDVLLVRTERLLDNCNLTPSARSNLTRNELGACVDCQRGCGWCAAMARYVYGDLQVISVS